MKKDIIAKFSDFMYYHKWHIILGIIAVASVVSFIWSATHKEVDDVTITAIVSNETSQETAEKISDAIEQNNIVKDINGDGSVNVFTNMIYVPFENSQGQEIEMAYNRANIAIVSKESVLFLIDEDMLEIYADRDAFMDISETARKFNKTEGAYINEDGICIGISLKDNEFLKSQGMVTDTLYGCYRYIPQDTDDKELSAKLEASEKILEFILN